MQTLNMLGQPCPIPVVQAKKLLEAPGTGGVEVLVDNFVAVQNLQKMAEGTGRSFAYVQQAEDRFTVTITGPGSKAAAPQCTLVDAAAPPTFDASAPVVLITADSMGRGAEELGKILIKGFIFSLTQLQPAPKAVLFLNGGVHLTVAGSNVVEDLRTLAQNGTVIQSCGTCLNYYGTTDKLAVGEVTDMGNIVNTLAGAARIITL